MGSSRDSLRETGVHARPIGRVGSDDRARPSGRVFRPVAVVGRTCAIARRLDQHGVHGDEGAQIAVEDRDGGVAVAARMVVMACWTPGLALVFAVFGLIQWILGWRVGGDMDVQRAMIDVRDLCVITVADRDCRPIRRMGNLVPPFLNPMQAQRRHEGGAQADANGAKQARQD